MKILKTIGQVILVILGLAVIGIMGLMALGCSYSAGACSLF